MRRTEFSRRLCAAMAYWDIRLSELADKMCVSLNTVTEWRAGRYMPNNKMLGRLAVTLDSDKGWLLAEGDALDVKTNSALAQAVIKLSKEVEQLRGEIAHG